MFYINEIFASIQGEGQNAGRPCVFVRFSGCNRACSFCDTQHDQPRIPMSKEQIIAAVDLLDPIGTLPVCFTGGEPTLQLRGEILQLAGPLGLCRSLWLETNGDKPLSFGDLRFLDYVTVSPKISLTDLLLAWGASLTTQVNEIRLIWPHPVISGWEHLFIELNKVPPHIPVYLSPQWNHMEPVLDTIQLAHEACIEGAKRGFNLRLSVQAHKFWRIP